MTESAPHAKTRHPTLSAADARLIDAALEARWRRAGVPQAELVQEDQARPADAKGDVGSAPSPAEGSADGAARAAKVESLLKLIGQAPAATPPLDLVQQTMARIDRVHRQERLMLGDQMGGPGLQARWAELGTVAAVLIVGFSLMIPALGRMREEARQVACAANLGEAGTALASYAADYNNVLPRRGAQPGAVWWNVGKDVQADGTIESNSAHLYGLVRANYAQPDALNCPDNPHAMRGLSAKHNDWPTARAVSYSYQNQHGRDAIQIDRVPRLALLADKNPLFVTTNAPLDYRADRQTRAVSPLHGRRGQNILQAGGNALWSPSPVLPNGDNIWLANHVNRYTGTETPSGPDDSFLVP